MIEVNPVKSLNLRMWITAVMNYYYASDLRNAVVENRSKWLLQIKSSNVTSLRYGMAKQMLKGIMLSMTHNLILVAMLHPIYEMSKTLRLELYLNKFQENNYYSCSPCFVSE